MIAYLILLVIIAVVAGMIYLYDRHIGKRQQRFREKGRRIMGTVTSVDEVVAMRSGNDGRHPWEVGAEFELEGKYYRAGSDKLLRRPACRVGDRIVIHYMPDNPNDNWILDESIP